MDSLRAERQGGGATQIAGDAGANDAIDRTGPSAARASVVPENRPPPTEASLVAERSASAASGEGRIGNTLTGIALKIASVSVFVGMSTSIKFAGVVPAGEIVFFRSFFAVLPVLVLFAWRGELRTALKTHHPFSHIARGLVGVSAMGLGF